MSAEGMPQAESFLVRPLRHITRFVVRYPVPVLTVAVGLAVFSIGLAFCRLSFRTSRLDLLNPHSSYNRLWIEYIDEFGDSDDVVVVVEGQNRDAVVPVLDEIARALTREDDFFRAVLHEVDLSRIRSKGLYYLAPDDLMVIEGLLEKVRPIVEGDWARLSVGSMATAICEQLSARKSAPVYAPDTTELEAAGLAQSLLNTLDERSGYRSPWPQMPPMMATFSELSSQYLLTNQGRMGFVLLQLAKKDEGANLARGTESIGRLRELIAQVRARHPEATIGLTGLPVMENDEMRSSQSSMGAAAVLSLFGVALLFIAGLGGIRHPLMAVGALLFAMAWALGYTTLAIGHLNILSASCGSMLAGLGDYGIHYVARYLKLREGNCSTEDALIETAGTIGPGVFTGATVTAVAFFTTGLTEFRGIAELGLITGGGVLLSCLATVIVLPALVQFLDAKRPRWTLPSPLPVDRWMAPIFKRPGLVLGVTAAGTALLALGVSRVWYDYNLLNLQADGLQSVELEKRLLAETEQSAWFALSIAGNREDLLERKARFAALVSVSRVDEIASMIPPDDGSKRPIIGRIYQRLANLPERPPELPVDRPDELGRTLARMESLLAGNPRLVGIRYQLEKVRDALRRLPEADCYRRLAEYQHQTAGDLLSRLHLLRAVSNPEPPRLNDLPEGLVKRFVGVDGKYLLKIYSKGNIWDMDAMEQFVREVRSVDPRATGNPLQTYEASREMRRSYEQAARYAAVAIVIVMLLDFGSLWAVFLALAPLVCGVVQMFGIMGFLNIPLNPANMIVLPLILGTGVDYSVHIVHDYRQSRGPYRITASTANSMLLCALTTIVGFGALMIAHHRGLQSLGRVLTIGLSCCLFSAMVMQVAMLALLSRRKNVSEAKPTGPGQEEGAPRLAPERRTRIYRRDPPEPPESAARPLRPDLARYDRRQP